jgi:hypothetical protein
MFIDNKYKTYYFRLMESAKSRQPQAGDKHHIIPKSIGGADDDTNLVTLSAREHLVAHKLLYRITSGSDKDKMRIALFLMLSRSDKTRIKSSREYQTLREEYSAYVSTNNPMHNPKSVAKRIASLTHDQSAVCSKRNLIYWADQGNLEKLSQHNKKLWSDPEYKKKRSANIRAGWTPERRAKASESAKKRWAKVQVDSVSKSNLQNSG